MTLNSQDSGHNFAEDRRRGRTKREFRAVRHENDNAASQPPR